MVIDKLDTMKLVEGSVENYKSIEEGQEIGFEDVNILVGENNTGKSSVIDALRDFRDVFPTGQEIDKKWVQRRLTRKHEADAIEFNFLVELSESERGNLFDGLVESDLISERTPNRWRESDFRRFNISLFLRPDEDDKGNIRGDLEVASKFDEERVIIRTGGLDEDGATYLDFNKLDSIEYSDRGRGWAEVLNIIQNSLNTWQFVGAFREPENLVEAFEHVELTRKGDNFPCEVSTIIISSHRRPNSFRLLDVLSFNQNELHCSSGTDR